MRFSILASALALVASAVAQQALGPNAFDLPTDGTLVFTAGQAKTLTWSNKAGSTVTIKLRTGENSDLQDVSTIVSGYDNTGSYTWTPDASLPEGADYALEIIDDQDPSQVNYSSQFVIQSNVKAVATGSSTGVVTVTPLTMSTASAAASSTSGASAATTTGTASGMTTSATASGSSSSAAHTSAASRTSAGNSAVPTENAAVKPAAGAAGGLLLVAAGFAIAL